MIKDSQKNLLYQVDQIFWQSIAGLEAWSELLTLEQTDQFTQDVFDDAMIHPYAGQRRRSRRTRVLVAETQKLHAVAFQKANRISYHRTFMKKAVVLHEVAHLLTWECTAHPHGARFVSVYANMIARHVGQKNAASFRGLCGAFRVSYSHSKSA